MRIGLASICFWLIGASLIPTGGVIDAAPANATPVEVWSGGDDGLTQRLRDALEHAFQSSPHFVLSSGKQSDALIVTIPTHVGWRDAGGRTQVTYTVTFASTDERNLGTSKGSCWDDALARCTAHILRDAEIAAHKMR